VVLLGGEKKGVIHMSFIYGNREKTGAELEAELEEIFGGRKKREEDFERKASEERERNKKNVDSLTDPEKKQLFSAYADFRESIGFSNLPERNLVHPSEPSVKRIVDGLVVNVSADQFKEFLDVIKKRFEHCMTNDEYQRMRNDYDLDYAPERSSEALKAHRMKAFEKFPTSSELKENHVDLVKKREKASMEWIENLMEWDAECERKKLERDHTKDDK